MFYSTFLEILISVYLNLSNTLGYTTSDIISVVVSWCCLVGCALFVPFVLIKALIFQDMEIKASKRRGLFKRRKDAVFERLKMDSKISIFFLYVFCLRRLIIFIVIFIDN